MYIRTYVYVYVCVGVCIRSNKTYQVMKLDSIERLPYARPLYTTLGFTDCAPYVENPEKDAIFLEHTL